MSMSRYNVFLIPCESAARLTAVQSNLFNRELFKQDSGLIGALSSAILTYLHTNHDF
jgi:hypothetical protein